MKYLAWGVAGLIGAPLAALAVWYSVSFLPHLPELRQLAQHGHESVEHAGPSLHSLALAGEGEKGIRVFAMRQAYASLVYQQRRAGMMSWHANNLLWYGASWIHFGAADVFDIWADCAIGGCGHDLNEAARNYFAKDLSELSEMQMAALVAAVRSPRLFAPGTESGDRRAREILERATVSHAS